MHLANSISVSELKTKLLEIVRRVEEGKVYIITKSGVPVARISPQTQEVSSPVGFCAVKILGDIISPIDEEWGFDQKNIAKRDKKNKKTSK